MNKPITLCDRCKVFMAGWHGGKEYARCCLNYDGDNCRRSRTVEPTNADRIRSMSDEELADFFWKNDWIYMKTGNEMLEWLKGVYRMTNFDRIKGMTAEELADWLTNYVCSNVAPHANARGATYKGKLIDWLKQEAT